MDGFIYARVSSKEQEREGFSIPAQLDLLRQYAKDRGIGLVQEFTEAETAKRSGRAQFQALIKAVKAHKKPAAILVEKTDRLYRNFKDYVELESLMHERGLEVHLVKEGDVLTATSTSHLKFIHGIKVLMAKNYIENLSEEIRKGISTKAKRGGWFTNAPYGYRMKSGELVIQDEEALFVRRAYEVYSSGRLGLDACADELRAMGLIFKPATPRIPKTNLARLLAARVYVGEVQYKGETYPGKHTPIIDRALWDRVQAALRRTGQKASLSKRPIKYQDLFTCGGCGSVITGDAKKGGKYVYYQCSNARHKRGCSEESITEAFIDRHIETFIQSLSLDSWLVEAIYKAVEGLDKTLKTTQQTQRRQLADKIEQAQRKLRQAYHDRLDGLITDSEYSEVAKVFKAKIEALQDELGAIGSADVGFYDLARKLVEIPIRLSSRWSSALDTEKLVILKILRSNFYVKHRKIHLEPVSAVGLFFKDIDFKHGGGDGTLGEKIISFISKHRDAIRTLYSSLAA